MNKKDKRVRIRKWQIIRSNAIASGCQNYCWKLGKVGNELKAIFTDNTSKKKNSNNVINLTEVNRKIA